MQEHVLQMTLLIVNFSKLWYIGLIIEYFPIWPVPVLLLFQPGKLCLFLVVLHA